MSCWLAGALLALLVVLVLTWRFTGMLPKAARWLRRRSLSRSWLDVVISVVGVLTVAFVGLLVEDLLPKPGESIEINAWRPVLAVVLTVLLSIVVWRRSRLAHIQGTFYYVRFLPGWMSDWHLQAMRQEAEYAWDERTVTRHVVAQPRAGVLDIAGELSEVSSALEIAINDDVIDTGFTLAPNLLWPAALSLGYGFHVPRSLFLMELAPSSADTLRWSFDDGPEPSDFDVPEVRTSAQQASEEVGSVLVTVDLTTPADSRVSAGPGGDDGTCTPPRGRRPDAWVRVAVFEEAGDDPDAPHRLVKVTTRPPRAPDSVGRGEVAFVHPRAAAEAIANGIETAARKFPQATLYVVARAPKSVMFAAGHLLSGPGQSRAGQSQRRSPAEQWFWTRTVFLLPDQGTRDQDLYHAVRAYGAQPLPDDIAERAKRHGLILSGGPP